MDCKSIQDVLYRFLLVRKEGILHKILTFAGIYLNGLLRVNYNMLIMTDDKYFCFKTELEFKNFIKKYYEEFRELYFLNYKKNISDCDNAAFLFQQYCSEKHSINAVAVVLDSYGEHAYNLIILETGRVLVFEPQTGEIIRTKNLGHTPYICERLVIIL